MILLEECCSYARVINGSKATRELPGKLHISQETDYSPELVCHGSHEQPVLQ